MNSQELDSAIKNALKHGDTAALNLWRMVKSKAESIAQTNNRKVLSDDDILKAIKKEISELLETSKTNPSALPVIEVLQVFLPQTKSQNDTEQWVKTQLNNGVTTIGALMKIVTADYDKALVSKIFKQLNQSVS